MNNVNIRGHFTLRNEIGDVIFENHNLVVYGGYDTIAALVGAHIGGDAISDAFRVCLYSGGENAFSRNDTSVDATLQARTAVTGYSLDTDKHSVIMSYTVSAASFSGSTTLTTAVLWFGNTLFSEVDLGDIEHAAHTAYSGTWEIIFGDDSVPAGDGTEDSPYLIASATQLDWFRSQVNGGDVSICGALIANITYNAGCDVAGYDGESSNTFDTFTPICNSSGGYKGTFDGRGNTISGLYINTGDYTRAGLFGYIGNVGIVKDVIVTNSYIATKYVGASIIAAGGIAGYNGGTVSGCTYNGHVDVTADCSESDTTTYARAGGIAGYSAGTISDCTSYCSVDLSGTLSGNSCSGGIAGHSTGTISDCTSNGSVDMSGTISGYIRVGGIAGSNEGAAVSDCSSYCSVDMSGTVSTYAYSGGIVGYNKSGSTVSGCSFYGSVDVSGTATSQAYSGGIVGFNGGTVSDNSLYGTYALTGSSGYTASAAIIAGGTSSGDNVYDNYDYTTDSVSAAALV